MPQHVEFRLPDVGEGLTEADIVGWLVQVGDTITVNQNIVEIETAKSLVELPSPHAGVVTALLVSSGDTVEVGAPIIRIDTDPDGSTPAAPDAGAAGAGAAGTGAAGAAEAGDSNADDGGVAQAAEAAGETEESGSVLVGYGTQQSSARRRPRKKRPQADQGTATVQGAAPGGAAGNAAQTSSQSQSQSQSQAGASRGADTDPQPDVRVLAKPPVRKLAKDLGIDLTRVPGTGPGGIVTRADVL